MLVSFLAVALNLLLNWIFTFRLGWGYRGLAFSTGCIATFNFLLLYALMRGHLDGLETRRMLKMLGKTAVATAALVAVCAASSHWLLAHWETQAFLGKLGALLGTVAVGAVVFAACGTALHIEELRQLQAAIQRRLRRVT
jgi:peptidoglycan biosynthesis protein MviN/MurJ (putative lipid II flippase)